MNKYDWSNVPKEVRFIATDKDGVANGFTTKPKPCDEYETGVTEATFAPCGKGCCEPRFESKGLEYIGHTNVTHWMYMPKPPKD